MPFERYQFYSRYVPFDSAGRKIRYTVFVVLVYVIPLLGATVYLINSSSNSSLGNQTANYTSSTTPPATPKPTLPASLGNQTANHTSSTTPPATTKPTSPASLGNQTANYTSSTTPPATPKPTLPVNKYKWVEYTPVLWNDTKLVKTNGTNSGSYVVAHSIYSENMTFVVGANINLQNLTIEIEPLYQISGTNPKIEVLLAEPGHYEWIKSSNGTIEKNAIEGGKMENETIYVCRIENRAGWMTPSKRRCDSNLLLTYKSTYDLLIHKI